MDRIAIDPDTRSKIDPTRMASLEHLDVKVSTLRPGRLWTARAFSGDRKAQSTSDAPTLAIEGALDNYEELLFTPDELAIIQRQSV